MKAMIYDLPPSMQPLPLNKVKHYKFNVTFVNKSAVLKQWLDLDD